MTCGKKTRRRLCISIFKGNDIWERHLIHFPSRELWVGLSGGIWSTPDETDRPTSSPIGDRVASVGVSYLGASERAFLGAKTTELNAECVPIGGAQCA
jgi:hypothetical protein